MCATEVSKQSIHSDANRLGLVIGNSSYPDADVLRTQTVNDASALASTFVKTVFDIYLVQNATRDDMTRAIAHLKTKVRPIRLYGLLRRLRYQSGGQSYMIPVDAKIWYEDDVRRDGVSIDRLLSELKNSGAHITTPVIDASRAIPYESVQELLPWPCAHRGR